MNVITLIKTSHCWFKYCSTVISFITFEDDPGAVRLLILQSANYQLKSFLLWITKGQNTSLLVWEPIVSASYSDEKQVVDVDANKNQKLFVKSINGQVLFLLNGILDHGPKVISNSNDFSSCSSIIKFKSNCLSTWTNFFWIQSVIISSLVLLEFPYTEMIGIPLYGNNG